MKNREYLISTNMYDLLVKMNESIMQTKSGICIMNGFMDEDDCFDRCGEIVPNSAGFKDKCKKCIADFMEENKS